MVAIQRTQFSPGMKIKPVFIGPYRVTKVLTHDRYEVKRIGNGEGPLKTTTAADHMKRFRSGSSETDDNAGMAECGNVGDHQGVREGCG